MGKGSPVVVVTSTGEIKESARKEMFIGPNHRSYQSLPKQNIVDKLGTALGLFSQDWVVFIWDQKEENGLTIEMLSSPPPPPPLQNV